MYAPPLHILMSMWKQDTATVIGPVNVVLHDAR